MTGTGLSTRSRDWATRPPTRTFAHDQPTASILDTAAGWRVMDLDVDRAVSWAVVWTVMVTVQAWRDDQSDLEALVESPAFRRFL